MISHDAITEFLASHLADGVRFELVSARDRERIADWKSITEGDAASVAEAIAREAEDDAHGEPQNMSYYVFAIAPTGERLGRKRLLIENARAASQDESMIALARKMLDVSLERDKRHDLAIDSIIDQLKDMVLRFGKELGEEQKKKIDLVVLIEEMLGKKNERELEVRRTDASIKQKDRLLTEAMPLLPLVANRALVALAKGNVSGPPPLADEMIRSFLGSLSETQLYKMMDGLSNEQKLVIMDIYMSYAKREEKKTADANGATETPPADESSSSSSEGAPS